MVIFDGVYPERTRCRAVEDPKVPPPPTTMTVIFSREEVMFAVVVLRVWEAAPRFTGLVCPAPTVTVYS